MALDDAEREESERLRAEVSDLRARAGQGTAAADLAGPGAPGQGGDRRPRRARQPVRWAVAAAARLEAWVGADKALLQVAGVVVGALVVALWDHPGAGVAFGVLLLAGGWVALVEYVGQAGPGEEAEAGRSPGSGPAVTGSAGA